MSRPLKYGSLTASEVADALADAMEWPRARPFRLVSGDRAHPVPSVALCGNETAIANVPDDDSAILLATPPSGAIGRLGRRGYDPLAGADDDISSWARLERVVFDGALPLSGGAGGVDEQLAEAAGIAPEQAVPVRPVERDEVKFVGFVTADDFERTRDAIFAAGGGAIGDYDACSWSTAGTGTFRGSADSNPTVGEAGSFTQVSELRLEVLVPRHLASAVTQAFVQAHSYEEPAFEVIPLVTPASVGFGRMGELAAPISAADLAARFAAFGGATVAAPAKSDSLSKVAIHVGELRNILGEVLMAGADVVVVSYATEAEQQLLVEREIALLLIDARAAVSNSAQAIAATLSKKLGVAVKFAQTLEFPDESQAVAAGSGGIEPAQTPDAESGVRYRMHFDGGSRGNPGPASYGWVIYDADGEEYASDGVMVGRATNNVAEWNGLLRGVEAALQHGITHLDIRGDSELIVKQATGVYRVKNADLKPLAAQVAELLKQLESYTIEHVYRDDNARADELANEAMDGLR